MKAGLLLVPSALQPGTPPTDIEARTGPDHERNHMSTTEIHDAPRPTGHRDLPTRSGDPTRTGGRAWALAGAAAGLCGIAVFVLAPMVADFPDSAMADNADMVTYLDGVSWAVWTTQVLTVVAAGLLVVFGAGLRRRLVEQEPVGSLLPGVAMTGAVLTAAMCLVGGGISTELFWHLIQDQGASDPDTIAANLAVFNTMPWVWTGLGLSSGAVAIAALRHGSAPRWLGRFSVAMTALVGLTQVVPLQYLALVPASIWLIAAGIGLARGERTA